MTSNLLASAVLAAAAMTSLAASAESFNPYLWDQMKAPSTKTRAEVRAEMLSAPAATQEHSPARQGSLASSLDGSSNAAAPMGVPLPDQPVPAVKNRAASLKTGAQ